MKNIIIISFSLLVIMLVSTLIVLGFNSLLGLSSDVNNEHVSTAIAAVAFSIALILRYFYIKE